MLMEILIFGSKTLILVLAIAAVLLLIAMLVAKASQKSELEIEPLHKKYKDMAFFFKSFTGSKDEVKAEKKKRKAEKKAEKKGGKEKLGTNSDLQKKVFVLNFEGDIQASQADQLREEITAVLQSATPSDEVVVKVESPGGVVHGYGLAASQLMRIRERKIPLTICVDKVAASGGYMMACVANKIICAPFAIVGSIGVVAQVPNLHRVLKKHDVDYKEYTAGEYKRTVSLLGEITPKGEEKFVERLNDTHVLFKNFVHQFRPQVDMNKVATGEYWFGQEAQTMGLVDHLQTSDDYLMSFEKDTPIFEVSYHIKQSLSDRISDMVGQMTEKVADKLTAALSGGRAL
jgi:serine protease SohB